MVAGVRPRYDLLEVPRCTRRVVIRVRISSPRSTSLPFATAGPATPTCASTNTDASLHSDGMHRVSFYFLKIPMDRMPPAPRRPRYTHAHAAAPCVCTCS